MSIQLRKLISITTQLTLEACKITRQSYNNSSVKQYMKGQDDPVTEADYKIQTMFTRGLKTHFPLLKIIGEESVEYTGSIDYDYKQMDQQFLTSQSQIHRSIDPSEACLWIDPIDCTRGFINGTVQDVTVLVGLSFKKQPSIGIIGTPFKKQGSIITYDPSIIVGSVEERQTFEFSNNNWQKVIKKSPSNPLKVCTSNTRTNNSQYDYIKQLKAENITAGGSGRKIIMVVKGEADSMVYLDSWTHKWDSCAGDAIVKSMGGYFKTPWGADIIYDENQKDTCNKLGMLVTLDNQIYKQSLDILSCIKV